MGFTVLEWSLRFPNVNTPEDTRKKLGGGLTVVYIFYFHPYLEKISISTNIFQGVETTN